MEHRLLAAPAGRIHVVVEGAGPLVLFVHGFPESWWSWEPQLTAVGAAGFTAAALDVRGYGRSSKPAGIGAYRMTELAADLVAVIDALSNDGTAVLVGHDWGSPVAAATTLLHPASVRAVALLSVPYHPPGGGPRPSEAYARAGRGEVYYISHFQEPGVVEAEIEPDVRGWLAGVFAALSGETATTDRGRHPLFVTPGGRMRDRFPGATPGWLGTEVLDVYAGEFERTGLAGALARYRSVDRDWEDLAAFDGAPLTPPSLFVAGALDPVVAVNRRAVLALPETMPGLRGSHLLPGVGHWLQREAPAALNRLLLEWLADLPAG